MSYTPAVDLKSVLKTSNITELKFEDQTGTEYQTAATTLNGSKIIASWKITGFDTLQNSVFALVQQLESEGKLDIDGQLFIQWMVSSDGGITWTSIARTAFSSATYTYNIASAGAGFIAAGAAPITELRLALSIYNNVTSNNVRAKKITARIWILLNKSLTVTRLV